MNMGRESRWDKDAMTVEIAFALVTAAVLAGVIFAASWALVLILDLSGSAGRAMLAGAQCSERWPECGVWYGYCFGSTSSAEWATDSRSPGGSSAERSETARR